MGDRVADKLPVEDVKHLKKGAVGRDMLDPIGLKTALGKGVGLTPYMKGKIHTTVFF